MMKRINTIFLWLLCSIAVSSCSREEISLYSSLPRIELRNADGVGMESYAFTDEDYVEKRTEKTFLIPVGLVGYPLEEGMSYCLKFSGNSGDSKAFNNPYTFPADTVMAAAEILLPAPASFKDKYERTVTFDLEDSRHSFEPGRNEKAEFKLLVAYQIRPADFSTDFWGTYSNNKYKVMMDCFGTTYRNIEQTPANGRKVVAYYKTNYTDKGLKLMDDEAEPAEIKFNEEKYK